jgi:hypothetical protein
MESSKHALDLLCLERDKPRGASSGAMPCEDRSHMFEGFRRTRRCHQHQRDDRRTPRPDCRSKLSHTCAIKPSQLCPRTSWCTRTCSSICCYIIFSSALCHGCDHVFKCLIVIQTMCNGINCIYNAYQHSLHQLLCSVARKIKFLA